MAENEVDDQKIADEAAAKAAIEAKATAEAEKEQTVKYATYDKAMATAAKRKQENDELKKQIVELEKSKMETSKNIDPTKYQEALESQVIDYQQKLVDLQLKFDTTNEVRDKQDLDRTKLSAVWDIARKAGMVDDRELLNFVDKDLVQVDEHGVVNIKSVETVVNKLKVGKPFFFQETKPEKINDKAPDGSDDTDVSKLSFSEQLKLQQQS